MIAGHVGVYYRVSLHVRSFYVSSKHRYDHLPLASPSCVNRQIDIYLLTVWPHEGSKIWHTFCDTLILTFVSLHLSSWWGDCAVTVAVLSSYCATEHRLTSNLGFQTILGRLWKHVSEYRIWCKGAQIR